MKQKLLRFYRKLYAISMQPKKINFFLKSEDIFYGGQFITCIQDIIICKILNPKRAKELKLNDPWLRLVDFASMQVQKEKFIIYNDKNSYIKDNILYFEKIQAKPLSFIIDEKLDFLNNLNQSIKKLKEEKNLSHGDFHIDNILIDREENIYFIDFEFIYKQQLLGYEYEADVINLYFLLYKNYKNYYLLYKNELLSMLFENFNKERVEKTLFLMRSYLKEFADEIY